MNTKITTDNETLSLALNGRLDTTTAQEFEKDIIPLLEKKPMNVYIDCDELSYISSSGLRVFLTMQKKVKSYNGKLTIKNMHENIKEIFDMIGFSDIFSIMK